MTTENDNPRTGNNSLTIGLASLTGIGFAAMATALAVGVSQGTSADSDSVGLLFITGLLMFIAGIAAWMSVKRPWENFDDINVPMYHGHHHDEEHD